MCKHLGMITIRFLSVDRRHGKGLLRDPRLLCQGRDPVPPPGELGIQIGKRQTFNWTLNRGVTGRGPKALEECRSQLVMSTTVRGKRSARCVGVPDGITA